MAIDAQDLEFCHPEAAAFLRSLTDEQAAKQPPLVLEQDGVAARYWREGGRVRWIMFQMFCKTLSLRFGHGMSIGFGINHPFYRKGRHHDRYA